MKTIKVALVALLVTGLGLATTYAQSTGAQPAKTAPAPKSQHLKKDGTPDMRYKENKQAGTAKTTKATDISTKPASTATKSTKGTAAKPSTKKSAAAKAPASK